MTTTTARTAAPRLSRPALAALLTGLPLAYWAKDAVLPWADQLFGQQDPHAFHGFWLSVIVLHLTTVVTCLLVLRRTGVGTEGLGLPTPRHAVWALVLLFAAGGGLLLVRTVFGPITLFGGTPFFGDGAPADHRQRLLWAIVAMTAGTCEEFIYRGVALSLLRRAGLGVPASVALATISFALMHGLAGIFGFPYLAVLAVAMSAIYLRTGRLLPGVVLHTLVDLSVILT